MANILRLVVILYIANLSIAIELPEFSATHACDENDPGYQIRPDAPKMNSQDGYELFIQAPLYAPVMTDTHHYPLLPEIFQYPFNETIFIRNFAKGDRGAMYIDVHHKKIQFIHDKKDSESILVDYQLQSCDVEPMVYETEDDFGSYGYFHGENSPIHIPFFEDLNDLTKFKIKKLGKHDGPFRGFLDVEDYEACINLKAMLKHVLSAVVDEHIDNTTINAILQKLIQSIPDFHVKATWHWASNDWQMEDGYPKDIGPVPLGIDFTGAASFTYTGGQIGSVYANISANVSMNMANYHAHYPSHDVNEDILQVPAGIHCKKRISEDPLPVVPTFPDRFHIKTETVSYGFGTDYFFNTEDYYDNVNQLYRIDVSKPVTDKEGSNIIEVMFDLNNNVTYEIDRNARTCKKSQIYPPGGYQYDSNLLSHLFIRVMDLFKFYSSDVVYIGVKPCRNMDCHYWTSRKKLTLHTPDGGETEGIYGIWATTDKWTQNFSSSQPIMENYIVAIHLDIYDRNGNEFAEDHLDIFDYRQLSATGGVDDSFFAIPDAGYCGSVDNPAEMPFMPNRYQYRGEFSSHIENMSSPIFLNYDASWNVIRYDYSPHVIEPSRVGTRKSHVYDIRSSTMYEIDLVDGDCKVTDIPPGYEGGNIESLHMLWPPTIQNIINERLLAYVGVKPCREMVCDMFEYVRERSGDVDKTLSDYAYMLDDYKILNPDIPTISLTRPLTRVSLHSYEGVNLVPAKTVSVDLYDFTDQRSVYWEYDIVAPCFANVPSKWLRIFFTTEDENALDYIHYDLFRVEMMEELRKNAANISPLRISGLTAVLAGDKRVDVEFKIRDRHPQEQFSGPSLNDAVSMIENSVRNGSLNIQIEIVPESPGEPILVFNFNADPTSFSACDRLCSSPSETPIIELDTGALVGTIIASIIGGMLVGLVALTIYVSQKHGRTVMSLFVGPSPPAGATSFQNPMNDQPSGEE